MPLATCLPVLMHNIFLLYAQKEFTFMETINKTINRETHLRDYFIVLDRHKWIIIAAVIVTLSSTVLYLRKQVPIYQAQASIIIEEPSQAQSRILPRQVGTTNSDYLYLDTQIGVIKTVPVFASAIKQLGFTTSPEGTQEFADAINELKDSIRVAPVKDTRIVNIIATYTEPEKAQAIANAVAQAYIDQDRMSRLQTGRDSVQWLSAQLVDLKLKLKKSENVFQNFKEKEGMITLDDKRSGDLNEISKINSDYFSTRADRIEIEAIIENINLDKDASQNMPVGLLDSPTLQRLGTELSQRQTELAQKRQRFKDTYPAVVEIKDNIKLTEQKIIAELKRQREFLKAQEDSFLRQQKTKQQETLNLNKTEMDYLALEREVTTNRELYNALLSKVKELSLAGDVDLNNIRIVEPATLPYGQSGVSRNMTLALGGILGLFLGIGFAFFLEYLGNTIKTPDDVEQYTGLSVLAIIPQIAEARNSKTPMIITKDHPKDVAAEAYRGLRTNLVSTGLGDSLKTIMITSTGPREGKTLTTVNLGTALANAGYKVLLIDADLRRPKLHRVFGVDRTKGLSALLAGNLTLDEAVSETEVNNLSLMPSGPVPPNPSEILGSALMKELLKYIREHYDIVILDAAPILGMTDAVVLSTKIDGTLIVIKTEEATRKALKVAVAQLNQVGAKVCGAILNNVNVKRDKYYYYYYYYYYSPYEDEEGKKVKKRKKHSKHQEVAPKAIQRSKK